MNQKESTIYHVVLSGSAYEIGAAQANAVKDIPDWVQFFQSGSAVSERPAVEETLKLLRRFCPAVEEEMHGFCDTLKIPMGDLPYIAYTHLQPRHCSHLVALPEVTASGHTLVGRNYDFGDSMDDMRLCTTRLSGKYAHIGFSSLFFGREEGMNEHGLVVTASVGGIPVGLFRGMTPPQANGLQFWAHVRLLLEECRTVEEAQALWKEIPSSGNPILLIADRKGKAVLAEGFGNHKALRPVENGWAVATNHFTIEEMCVYHPTIMAHSQNRACAAARYLENQLGKVDMAGIKSLLGTKYPQGLACHFYEEWFGALHSMVFDLDEQRVDICFGSPAANSWYGFDLQSAQPASYACILPQERTTPEFWAQNPR